MTRDEYIENIFADYSLISVLSTKNNGKVLRLRHKKLEKDIVLRSYSHSVCAYSLLLSIQASVLPEVYDVIELEDGQVVLEEFIPGLTVAQVMETRRYHCVGAKKVMKALCFALSILHFKGIVHRDIKPENIIVTPTGRVVLIDLNASRQISTADKDTVIMGTVGYASPEQMGITQSDTRTDIYAAGVLFNVMLTGVHPSQKIAEGYYGRIVKRCTAINPDDRYQSAKKLARVL